MHVTSGACTKKMKQTVPGELIRLGLRKTILYAIVLAKGQRGTLVALLSPVPGSCNWPSLSEFNDGQPCISFGVDWIVEPVIGDESWVDNSAFNNASGALILRGEQYLVLFHPHPEEHGWSEMLFNFNTKELDDDFGRIAAPFAKWHIWESQKHYDRTGCQPLVTVQAVKVP